MCFSATASFGSSAALAIVGIAILRKVKFSSHTMFAVIPLIFSFQQFSEGILWLSFSYPEYERWHQLSMHIFLAVAQVIWPLWVPVSILIMERDKKRIPWLAALSVVGITISSLLFYSLCTTEVIATASNNHIAYTINYPFMYVDLGALFYVLATTVPPFVSSIKRIWVLGIVMLLSYILTKLFLSEYLVSLWCFFASILSLIVYLVLYKIEYPLIRSRPLKA